MGFYRWIEKDRSRSPVARVIGYLITVPLELFFGSILGFIPLWLISRIAFALGLPEAAWRVALWPVWIACTLVVLLLFARGNPDKVATLCLLRGRIKQPCSE